MYGMYRVKDSGILGLELRVLGFGIRFFLWGLGVRV